MSTQLNLELFVQTFQSIITTQPNSIELQKIEILVGLIENEDSRLCDLTGEYIDPLIQTRLLESTMLYQSCTTPKFIKNIWTSIKLLLISRLTTDIARIDFPQGYNDLDAVKKCEHVGHILDKLDTIHQNLFPGVVSFFSHTLQGLSGDLNDKVNSHLRTADQQQEYITSFAENTQYSITFITDDMQEFSRKFLSTRGKLLPQMCYYGKSCIKINDPSHTKMFLHPWDNDTENLFYFESLVMKPKRVSPYGGGKSLKKYRKNNIRHRSKRRYHTRHRRTKRHTRRRRH